MGQVILSDTLPQTCPGSHQDWQWDFFQTYFAPFVFAVVSALLLPVQLWFLKRRNQQPQNEEPDYEAYQHDRKAIFTWKTVRLTVSVVLTVLAVTTALSPADGECSSRDYIYATLLAVLSLFRRRIQSVANFHLVTLLLVTFGTQAWKYLVPFALSDQDLNELSCDWPIWLHLVLLVFVAVVVPLCIPRLYVPLDPKSPSTPNPEQTASLISLITYTYLDPVVFAAYRASKLEYDQLPPLADYDHATVLRQHALDALDPIENSRNKKRHVFWGLMQIFWREYSLMGFLAIIKVTMELSGPLGIRFLLKYMENPSEPGYLRPWVWVIWLFLGPVIGSLVMQWYLFLTSTCLVRAEAIITQAIFEHSLRLRMTSEVPGKASGTSDVASERTVAEGGEACVSHTPEGSESTAVAAGTDSTGTKGNEPVDDSESNLIGKINNLMSTDLGNIVEGRDFLFLVTYVPFEIVCSAILLYWILGWSAVVGMISMALFFPLPRKVAQLVNGIQEEKMKRADARVQNITEVMSVIRMVKLFGWENKTKAQVEEKREAELYWYKKKRILVLANLVTNYTLPMIVMMITFACHTLVFKQKLDASMVFSSISIFEILRNHLNLMFTEITIAIQAKVSLDRVDDFLKNAKLLDGYSKNNEPLSVEPTSPQPSGIGFRDATFTWTKQLGSTPNATRNFKLVIDQELLFHRGKINMVVGPTGCGKTSLLLALLGEMHFTPSSSDSWFGLPKEGGVAYAAQEAWVLNETIRNNILFGLEYDQDRYNKGKS
ncbi:ATP-binding cassette transporter abc4 OS=Schizosaccharomyces pombe (strain 972 / ATCC 24843) GN=abc4 PE=3 SV=1 [Rhizoctonia solani AG-1 IB]|uniref:ATP-binding cassette transporter abc4 n=1 Tax=Thanatephorus cucumeris (strain AG1-IB / isolate 7/3/14) TaxID=1108050 RepID=A0A0B7FF06_THACB|nr:ATP-binding cassette transporter abc4 OS=Schizosaccharomyces pombe (strain 972 / ATCC 24843) GN=abc4 PE=3 SV=1 [Rhizoctonia solani AG-1 IB]